MSRDVCGICWCPYDGDGKCGCKPVKVIDPAADEALLRQALEFFEHTAVKHPSQIAPRDDLVAAIKERLK